MASSAELEGVGVLVAGATGGIGRAVARRLGGAGARLVVVARTAGTVGELAREVGGIAVAGDVADQAFVRRLKAATDEAGGVDVVIHAAGAFDLAPVAETPPEMFQRMLDGNLTGPFLLCRAYLPEMLNAGQGTVVLVGSVAGRAAFPGNGAYSASKFGLRGLHAVLQEELRGTGVRCTLVEPAATDTAIWEPFDPDSRDDLPPRSAMLSADAVADAVHYAITRPADVLVHTVAVQRS
jgi:NADP-dependent 3-hydroxy acid dehydrogenase YdfG